MNILGVTIKQFRTDRDWTQNELAKRSGVDRGTLASIETGKAQHPTTPNLLKLARAFNIHPDELYQAAGYIKNGVSIRPIKETSEDILERLRVAIPATVPLYEDFPFHPGDPVEPMEYVATMSQKAKGRNLEAYMVDGKYLEPEIQKGDMIIVDRDGPIDSGSIVAALFNGILHIARFRKVGGEMCLENNYGRIKFDDCQVAALVIEVTRRFK